MTKIGLACCAAVVGCIATTAMMNLSLITKPLAAALSGNSGKVEAPVDHGRGVDYRSNAMSSLLTLETAHATAPVRSCNNALAAGDRAEILAAQTSSHGGQIDGLAGAMAEQAYLNAARVCVSDATLLCAPANSDRRRELGCAAVKAAMKDPEIGDHLIERFGRDRDMTGVTAKN